MVPNLGKSREWLLVGWGSSDGILLPGHWIFIRSRLHCILKVRNKPFAALKLNHERLLVQDVPSAVDTENFLFLKVAMAVSWAPNRSNVRFVQNLDQPYAVLGNREIVVITNNLDLVGHRMRTNLLSVIQIDCFRPARTIEGPS